MNSPFHNNRVEFKIAILVHKCIYGVAPQYLLDLIKIIESSRYQLRSHQGILLMDNTYRTKKTLGDRTFENVAPKSMEPTPFRNQTMPIIEYFKSFTKDTSF